MNGLIMFDWPTIESILFLLGQSSVFCTFQQLRKAPHFHWWTECGRTFQPPSQVVTAAWGASLRIRQRWTANNSDN